MNKYIVIGLVVLATVAIAMRVQSIRDIIAPDLPVLTTTA